MPNGRQAIERLLWEQLTKARGTHNAAQLTFDSLVKQVPTELPYPDGILSIQRAGMEAHVALEGYMRALKRYTDFTLYKVIPEDLANVAKE